MVNSFKPLFDMSHREAMIFCIAKLSDVMFIGIMDHPGIRDIEPFDEAVPSEDIKQLLIRLLAIVKFVWRAHFINDADELAASSYRVTCGYCEEVLGRKPLKNFKF